MIEKTIEILASKKSGFLDSVAKFNKKAVKLDVAPMTVEWGEVVKKSYYASEVAEILNVVSYHVYQEVTVSYEVPKIEGWDLVCIFDYETYVDENEVEKKAVFVNKVPDKVVPFEYQNKTEIHCEHCGHNRYRVKSYLVQHESGEYKEVGSTCLKDFLGHDPNSFLWFAQVETRIKEWSDEFGDWVIGDPVSYSVHGILALSSAVMKKYGWVSRSDQYVDSSKVSTADMVESYLTQKNKTESEMIYPDDSDKEIAEKTIEYFKSVDNQDNDYLMNCKKIVEINRVPFKKMGLACSMVKSYRNHLEYLARQELKAEEKESNWFGEIGDKVVKVKVKCVFKTYIENNYGYGSSTLYKFVDYATGNIYKTFYSGYTWEVEQDEEVLLSGTVKKHDEWNGKKENMLTRCKVFELEPIS